jgi:hypothetical protein
MGQMSELWILLTPFLLSELRSLPNAHYRHWLLSRRMLCVPFRLLIAFVSQWIDHANDVTQASAIYWQERSSLVTWCYCTPGSLCSYSNSIKTGKIITLLSVTVSTARHSRSARFSSGHGSFLVSITNCTEGMIFKIRSWSFSCN